MGRNYSKSLFILCIILTISTDVWGFTRINRKDSIHLYFRFDDDVLYENYRSNKEQLKVLDSLFYKYKMNIDSIDITSFSSIEGDKEYNKKLSNKRSLSVKKYIESNYYKISNITLVKMHANGEDWNGLLDQSYKRKWIPERDKLISILEDSLLSQNEKKDKIYKLKNGEVFDYLNQYVLWRLRNSSSIILWYKDLAPVIDVTEKSYLPIYRNEYDLPVHPVNKLNNKLKAKEALFAIKTNLLFDALTALNIELELPIRKHFSIAGEWTFPFWKSPKSDLTLNLLYGKLDLKYWLGNRSSKEVLTGWFCDVYGGYGKYDFQLFSKRGSQGHFLNTGLGLGYAHRIKQNLRIEYAIGFGFLKADYNKYRMAYDTEYGDIKVVPYPWQKIHKNWIGPTKASISLVWLINKK